MIVFENANIMVPEDFETMFSTGVIDEILLDIAEAARSEWIRIAQDELMTSRRDYINGIQKITFVPGTATISLLGQLPNMIEQGMDEQSMHETLLGPNVPVAPKGQPGKRARKAGGYYRSIPFRHGSPGSGGATGQPTGRPYRGHEAVADAGKLGRSIFAKMKKLSATTSHPDTGTAYGGRLPGGLAPKLRPYHSVDIYAGAIREEKTYKKATQSQYITFRTIAVDAGGNKVGNSPWIRPKTPGRFFAKRVEEYVQKIAPLAFDAYVKGLSSK